LLAFQNVVLGFRSVCRNTNVISVIYFEEVKIRTKEINVHQYVNRIPDKMHPKSNLGRLSQNSMLNNREIKYSEFLILYRFVSVHI